jgi:phosphatidylinositol-3-phosphatase
MIKRLALPLVLAAAAAAVWVASATSSSVPNATPATVPQLNHVFIVTLENENAADTFGPNTEAPYLANTLKSQGAYIPNYYGIGHLSLDNYIAMISGQAPSLQTQADCPIYTDFTPAGVLAGNGQYVGQGCVFPPGVQNIATQLEGNGWTWKGYMQDMANSAPAQPASCRHPAVNSQDSTQSATATDQYAARHNPFVYFHSLIDFPTCQQHDVDLNQLSGDLASESTTPNYAFITPDLCNDGHDSPCADGVGPGGLTQADSFLQSLIPQIEASPAYRNRGLIVITFDEAHGGTSPADDGSACCGEQAGPNSPFPGGLTLGMGGGKVGAVLLSPCITAGTVTSQPYNHYSLLRSVEDNFALPHLGFAGQAGLRPFGTDILNKASC